MRLLLTIMFLYTGYTINAQNSVTTRLEKMKAAQFLKGNWVGKGWMLLDGKKEYFEQRETISPKLEDALLLVEGLGRHAQTDETIHNALAVLTYDVGRQQYRWLSGTSRSGYLLDVVAEVSENKLIWGFSNPAFGQIRYTIRLENGEWVEIGEMSTDNGQSWKQTLEMRLRKQ